MISRRVGVEAPAGPARARGAQVRGKGKEGSSGQVWGRGKGVWRVGDVIARERFSVYGLGEGSNLVRAAARQSLMACVEGSGRSVEWFVEATAGLEGSGLGGEGRHGMISRRVRLRPLPARKGSGRASAGRREGRGKKGRKGDGASVGQREGGLARR